MKKKQPSETADDKLLGKAIAAELRRQLAGAESDCPDTETVAGFYDRTLGDNERAYWEKHFLNCMRCQEYLAELARLADADEPPPVLGEDAEPAKEESSPGWFYRLAWVIPFVVIGIGSAIWYYEDIQRVLHRDESAMNTAPPVLPPATSLPAANNRFQEKASRPDKDVQKPGTPAPAALAKAKAAEAPGASSMELVRTEHTAGGEIAGAPARADERDSAKAEEAKSKQEVAAAAAPVSAPSAASNAPAEGGAGLGAGKVSGFGALSVRGAQQKAAAQWRVGRRGTIQKADGQGGWTRIVSGVEDDLFDITFAGSTGWAVGHGGIVLRSGDGGDSWQKVTSPTSEDLVHVSSLGSQQASVFSRSGKTYSTSDGGQTWK